MPLPSLQPSLLLPSPYLTFPSYFLKLTSFLFLATIILFHSTSVIPPLQPISTFPSLSFVLPNCNHSPPFPLPPGNYHPVAFPLPCNNSPILFPLLRSLHLLLPPSYVPPPLSLIASSPSLLPSSLSLIKTASRFLRHSHLSLSLLPSFFPVTTTSHSLTPSLPATSTSCSTSLYFQRFTDLSFRITTYLSTVLPTCLLVEIFRQREFECHPYQWPCSFYPFRAELKQMCTASYVAFLFF